MKQSCLISESIAPPDELRTIGEKKYSRLLRRICDDTIYRCLVISFPFFCDDPLQWFSSNRQQKSFQYYWEKPSDSFVIAALGASHHFTSNGPHRFESMQQSLDEIRPKIAHLNASEDQNFDVHFLGGFSFFDEMQHASWSGFKPGLLMLPQKAIIKKGRFCAAFVTISIDENEDAETLHQKISTKLNQFPNKNNQKTNLCSGGKNHFSLNNFSGTQLKNWKELVSDAKQKITQNEFGKIVLGRQLELDLPDHSNAISALDQLRSRFPECYSFLIKHENSQTFIGSTPELLLSVKNNRLKTEALAGSIARGADDTEDEKLESELLESMKNNEEHQFVVRDIQKLLAPLVENLKIADRPEIKKLSNVQHLYTPVRAKLKEQAKPLSLLKQLHPTPAVGGTPRNQALEYIRQNEPFSRGWFAAPVGWITLNEDAQFAVAIRSGLLSENTALLFAGCGIVAGSDPEMEWQETNLKFSPMLSALNYD